MKPFFCENTTMHQTAHGRNRIGLNYIYFNLAALADENKFCSAMLTAATTGHHPRTVEWYEAFLSAYLMYPIAAEHITVRNDQAGHLLTLGIGYLPLQAAEAAQRGQEAQG